MHAFSHSLHRRTWYKAQFDAYQIIILHWIDFQEKKSMVKITLKLKIIELKARIILGG